MTTLGEKALACLRISDALHRGGHARWLAAYNAACARWSAKAVDKKFQGLVDLGYLECGVSARTGWLTDKGRAVLAQDDTTSEDAA
jgi:hypothetical protein